MTSFFISIPQSGILCPEVQVYTGCSFWGKVWFAGLKKVGSICFSSAWCSSGEGIKNPCGCQCAAPAASPEWFIRSQAITPRNNTWNCQTTEQQFKKRQYKTGWRAWVHVRCQQTHPGKQRNLLSHRNQPTWGLHQSKEAWKNKFKDKNNATGMIALFLGNSWFYTIKSSSVLWFWTLSSWLVWTVFPARSGG
jgi:hypothetical protein